MIDLHCHVLPGIDDGPATVEGSLELCRAAHAAGTRTIVATPHLNWDYPEVSAAMVHQKVLALNSALRAAAIDVTVCPGAEVALSRVAEISDAELGLLRLGGGPYVLVECPWTPGTAGVVNSLRAFADRGYGIVLAHPERSPAVQRNVGVMQELVGAGMLTCITARSLTERADRRARSAAWELVGAGLAHVIASDAHETSRRPPDLGPALERAGLDNDQIDYFTRVAPAAVITGGPLAEPPLVDDGHRRRWSGRRRR